MAPSASIHQLPVSLHLQLLLNQFLSSQQPPGQTMSYMTRTIIMRLPLSALQTSTHILPAGSYSDRPKTQILPSLPLLTPFSGFPHLRCKLFSRSPRSSPLQQHCLVSLPMAPLYRPPPSFSPYPLPRSSETLHTRLLLPHSQFNNYSWSNF